MNKNEIVQKWLNSPYVDKEMKTEIKAMSDDDIKASFKDIPLEFGTAGYRAKMGPGPLFLNEFTYQQLAVGYARYLTKDVDPSVKTKKKIKAIIAHDNRRDGDKISMLITKVLTAYGIEVYLVPSNSPLPTPVVSYLIRTKGLDGGVNVTASHNPKEYNGFKAYNDTGAQVSVEQATTISSLLPDQYENMSKVYTPVLDLIKYINQIEIDAYFNDVTKHIGFNAYEQTNNPVIFTPHHGTCSLYVTDFLRSLGHNVIPVDSQSYLDSEFTNSLFMNPEDPRSFVEAEKLAAERKSDIMLGVDPDGDRLAVAVKHNGKWEYLNGNETGILATNYLLKYHETADLVPIVISTYVTNSLINNIVEDHNGLVLRTGTGFKNIAAAMEHIDKSKAQFIVAFEEAIGMCVADTIREKDGIAAAALVLEMYNFYKNTNLDLIDVLEKQIYQKYGFWYGETVSLTIPGADWKEKAQELEHKALSFQPSKVGDFMVKEVFWNGAGQCIEWILKDDAWIKFRISGTEPKFKIYYNLFFDKLSPDRKYKKDKFKEVVNNLTTIIKQKLF